MECAVAEFPCKYLGLPLSIRRLTKTDMQPYIDKTADMLPGWKAAHMATSGCLVLVKAVLTAIPIHLLLALDLPKWFIKAVDKWRRSFLWRGHKELRGGHCPVSWNSVTRPLHLGGLGIIDLEIMSWALRIRWLWQSKTQPDKPWAAFDISVPNKVRAMFEISVTTAVGDGATTLFWSDRWLQGKSIQDLAPALMPFVRRRGWRKQTVRRARAERLGSKTWWEASRYWQHGKDYYSRTPSPSSHCSRKRRTCIHGRRAPLGCTPPRRHINVSSLEESSLNHIRSYGVHGLR